MSADALIRQTLAKACQYLDDRRFREWADLYTVDAEMGRMRGREDIFEKISNAELALHPEIRRKHLIVNSIIAVDGEMATALSDLVMIDLVEAGGSTTRLGRYHDTLALINGTWLFSHRRLEWFE